MAQETLKILDEVSRAARRKIAETPKNLTVWPPRGPWDGVTKLDEIMAQNRISVERLRDEPAIARIACTDSNGVRQTYFPCRKTPMVQIQECNVHLASYRSPVGQLAALGIGEELDLTETRFSGRGLSIDPRSSFKNKSERHLFSIGVRSSLNDFGSTKKRAGFRRHVVSLSDAV
ncbi:MAG: hypothetical protein F4Z66_09285 [Gammaproteobacteria bacterium]|nr:hypothetical protein [Gammaproteobacteria bacterium]